MTATTGLAQFIGGTSKQRISALRSENGRLRAELTRARSALANGGDHEYIGLLLAAIESAAEGVAFDVCAVRNGCANIRRALSLPQRWPVLPEDTEGYEMAEDGSYVTRGGKGRYTYRVDRYGAVRSHPPGASGSVLVRELDAANGHAG